jgi:phage-related protein
MADGTIVIDVELNEKAFRASLENMGELTRTGAEQMIRSVDSLSGSFVLLPNTINTVMNAVPGIISSVINNIRRRNPAMTETGTDFFLSMISDISGINAEIGEAAGGLSASAIRRFTDFLPDMQKTGAGFFGSLIADMPGIIREITGAVPEMTQSIAEEITDNEYRVANAGFGLFTSLTMRLPRAIREVSKAPGEIVASMTGRFEILNGEFNTVGENMVQGVWVGISGMGGWLSNKVTSFFSGIVGAVTGFLGISSPSKLFRDLVGKNIALGVKSGIDDEMGGVISGARDQMSRLASVCSQSARLAPSADMLTRSNILSLSAGGHQPSAGMHGQAARQSAGSASAPEINVILEPSGDMRGFFDYISMGIKRSAYLNGEE